MLHKNLRLIGYYIKPYMLSGLVQWIIMTAVMTLILIGYKLDKSVYFQLSEALLDLPEGVYGFLGIPLNARTGNVGFYIIYPYMFFNVWLIWKGCERVFEITYCDEISGRILSLCGQIYSRYQLCICKYLAAIIVFTIQYIPVYISGIVIVKIGGFNDYQRASGTSNLLQMMFTGLTITYVMIILTYIVSLIKKTTYISEGWLMFLIFGTLTVGNLHRIRDIFRVILEYMGIMNLEILDSMQWMDKLVIFSPLSWLNPYMERSWNYMPEGICVCILICALGLTFSCILYNRREFYSKY